MCVCDCDWYSFSLWNASNRFAKAAREFLEENNEELLQLSLEISNVQQEMQESFNKEFNIDDIVFNFETNTTIFERNFIENENESFEWETINFDFKNTRTSEYIIELEELERKERIQKGVNPILFGKWHRIGLEFTYRYNAGFYSGIETESILETAAEATNTIIDAATNLAEKASELHLAKRIENFAESVVESVHDLHLSDKVNELKDVVVEKVHDLHLSDKVNEFKDVVVETASKITETEVQGPDFVEHGDLHLNLFAYTSEKVIFSWPRRVPAYIYKMEELARLERTIYGVDPIVYGRWNRLSEEFRHSVFYDSSLYGYVEQKATSLYDSAKNIASSTKETVSEFSEDVTDALGDAFSGSLTGISTSSLTGGLASGLTHSIPNDVSGAMTGFFGTIGELAHSLADSTNSFVESTKDRLGYISDPSSIAAEEKERTRRMNNSFVDPMIEARKRRVEEELLHNTVKSI